MNQKLVQMKQELVQSKRVSTFDEAIDSLMVMILKAHRISKQANDPKNEWRPLVSAVMSGKDDPFEAAKSVIEKAYPDLLSTLCKKHPDLSETDARVCLLSCPNLNNMISRRRGAT